MPVWYATIGIAQQRSADMRIARMSFDTRTRMLRCRAREKLESHAFSQDVPDSCRVVGAVLFSRVWMD